MNDSHDDSALILVDIQNDYFAWGRKPLGV